MENARATFYKRLNRLEGDFSLSRRKQDVLYDKKWKLLLKHARLFRHIPFVEVVFAAGSMALGNVRETSDFDVLVVARRGRIFTTRFFSILLFGVLGLRRTKLSHDEAAADKICLNHFVTTQKMRLSPPYNIYWEELYRHLVPLYGDLQIIDRFFAANDWLKPPRLFYDDLRYDTELRPSLLRKMIEKILEGLMGNWVEKILRRAQIKRIERGLNPHLDAKPRICYNDEELEFHPDTRRIEKLIS